MNREQIARVLFACDEQHGPIRMNVPYDQLKSFQRTQYERYADALVAALDPPNVVPFGDPACSTTARPSPNPSEDTPNA